MTPPAVPGGGGGCVPAAWGVPAASSAEGNAPRGQAPRCSAASASEAEFCLRTCLALRNVL